VNFPSVNMTESRNLIFASMKWIGRGAIMPTVDSQSPCLVVVLTLRTPMIATFLFEMGYAPDHKRMKRKPAKLPAHKARVGEMGCLVCHQPACIHHITEVGHGKITRDDSLIVPLCAIHHNMGNDSIHLLGSNERFREVHGICLIEEARVLRLESAYLGIKVDG
jgi:hypothetical protein